MTVELAMAIVAEGLAGVAGCDSESNEESGGAMTKYERTGEKTYDPAVAVGWGVWLDFHMNTIRVTACGGSTEVVTSAGSSRANLAFGVPPYERMREAVEPRSSAELRRWMVAHPRARVKPVPPMEPGGWQAWWDPEACRFAWTVEIDFDPTDGPHVPDGGGWGR